MFGKREKIRVFAPFEVAITRVEISFGRTNGGTAIAEFATGNHAIVVVEMAQIDAQTRILKKAVFNAMLRA